MRSTARPVRVLLVEDSEVDVILVTRNIPCVDWVTCGTVSSAEEALEKEGPFDVVLLDLMFPSGQPNGVDFLRRHPNPAPVVIGLTGLDEQAPLAQEAIDAGAQVVLLKGEENIERLRALLRCTKTIWTK